jgi:hypothetical protein
MQTGHEIVEHQGNGSYGGEIIAQGGAVQQVRSAFCTAVSVQKARDIGSVKRKLLDEARLMGEDAYYGWGAGKSAIEGPSIDLAVAAARCWGNCATDMLPVQDLADCWIFTAAFIDLETGYTRTRQFRQAKKHVVAGKMDDERKDDIRFQIGQSKAERNVILKALPSWLINAALEAAKAGVRQELENLTRKHGIVHVADRLVTALMKCGVKEPAILAKCAVADRKGLTVDHLVILRGDLSAIQNGQERADVLFPAVEAPAPTPPPPAPAPTPQQEATPEPAEAPPAAPPKKALKKTLKELEALCKACHRTPPEIEEYCSQYKVQSFADLTEADAQSIIAELQASAQRQPGDEPEGD